MFGISIRVWLGMLVAAMCAWALVAFLSPPAPPPQAAGSTSEPAAGAQAPAAVRAHPGRAAATSPTALEPPFDAAQLFEIGFAGGLRIDADTRAALEVVMNSIGDPPTEQDLQRIEISLRRGLPAADAAKTMVLVRSYVAYVGDVKDQLQPMGIPKTQQEASTLFDRMDAMKSRHFDPATREALFGTHDRDARVSMLAALVQADTLLSDAQKRLQLDALRSQLPAGQQWLVPPPGEEAKPPFRPASG